MTFPGAITTIRAHPTNTLGPPNNPKGFCVHTPEEPADDYPATPYWFSLPHPDRAGSTTWFISTKGTVYECVPEDVAAIANGVIGKPYPAWADPNVSLNRQTVSVEVEGYAATIGTTLTAAQRASLVALIRYAAAKYGFPIDRAHIFGHYEVANNRSDPGTLPIDAIIAEAQEDDMTPEQDAILRDIQDWVKTDIPDRLTALETAVAAITKDVADEIARRGKD